jgi:hypothetical protein
MHKGGHQDFSAPSSTDEKITYSKRFIAVYAHIRMTIFSFAK